MQTEIKNRSIKCIFHFTQASNVSSILTHGLLSRDMLVKKSIIADINDALRLDGQTDTISCSISFPNYKMFYRLRMSQPDINWVVIGISPEVLYLKNCIFCKENAANNSVTSIPVRERTGLTAFRKLFEERADGTSRASLGIKNCHPTNPQAEVLVPQQIELKHILGIACENNETRDLLISQNPTSPKKIFTAGSWFCGRDDFQHW